MPIEITREIGSSVASDLANAQGNITPDTKDTDGVSAQDETTYQNTKWSTFYGYFANVPEVNAAITTLSHWVIGDGYVADARTTTILDHIQGEGISTFDDIIENMDKLSRIGGDAFAEIIKDKDSGTLLNLKVLNPGSMRIVYGKKGEIKRYEQVTKTGKGDGIVKFKPDEIFHFSNKKIADSLGGQSDLEPVEKIILALNESFQDMKTLQHRHVQPRWAFQCDTDNPTKIAQFKIKMDAAIAAGENIYMPLDSVKFELLSVPSNATLNPLPWQEVLKNKFYQMIQLPQILVGGASDTFSESGAKISYLSFEQTVKQRQRYIITQIWNQLFLKVDFPLPASIQNDLVSDANKDGANQQMGFQPADFTAGKESV